MPIKTWLKSTPVIVAAAASLIGCTALSTVRSAAVQPGPIVNAQVSITTPPGEEAGWFWDDDCGASCNHPIVATDVTLGYSWRTGGGPPITASVGVNGAYPYLEGYVQLGDGVHPFGLGVRIGVPLDPWNQYQLYGRFDVPLRRDARLLLNPGLFLQAGESPNGENDGSFLGLVQGVGIEVGGGPVTVIPAVALVVGRSQRTNYGVRIGPVTRAFAAASLGIAIRPGRPSAR